MKSMIALLFLISNFKAWGLEIGKPAPDFTLGKVSLSQHKDKIVVLEWINHGCPFVRKHYDSDNMQKLQKKYVSPKVVWFSINSSAPGKQGHVTATEAKEEMLKYKSGATEVLLDPQGKVGQLYGAKTTPHMYIINKGILVYQGAIDDKADTSVDSVEGAKNYVARALEELSAGKKVSQAETKAYGCSVKY
jgi:hypothetical protein